MTHKKSSMQVSNLIVNKIKSKDYIELLNNGEVSPSEVYEINYQDQLDEKAPAHIYGTEDLVEGESTLPVGTLYLMYE